MIRTAASNSHGGDDAREALCQLLLELAGRSAGRMSTARRHAQILDAAVPHMTLPQRVEAQRRIRVLETRWGPMLPGANNEPENDEMPPETRVARWLSKRKTPVRYLKVLRRAATKVAEGETSISEIMDHAFARETDYMLTPVGFDSFKEWMIELRIAKRVATGVYGPGSLCGWWIDQMVPSNEKGSPYRACMEQAAACDSNARL